MKLNINYWDHSKEICIDFTNKGYLDHSITITRSGVFSFDIESEEGSGYIYFDFLGYDLCCLMALWQETYGRQDNHV